MKLLLLYFLYLSVCSVVALSVVAMLDNESLFYALGWFTLGMICFFARKEFEK